jgi:hypothetical protein
MKKRIAVIGLMVCIICGISLADAAAAGKSINNYALIKYVLKRAHIDFDVVVFERADGIYKGMVISVPGRAPLIVAINETAAEKNTLLFSVNGEDTLATISKNGTLILKAQQEGDPSGFLCIFQAILDLIQAIQGCEQGDTICVFENLIAFVTDVLGCSATQ